MTDSGYDNSVSQLQNISPPSHTRRISLGFSKVQARHLADLN